MTHTVAAPLQGQDPIEPSSALRQALRLYHEAGLRLPPVPREFIGRVEELGDWLFATAPVELTDRAGFLAAARDPTTPPQIGFGHVGHGIASWWLCYLMISDTLAVFVRIGYGGVYADNDASVELFNAAVERIEQLIAKSDTAWAGKGIALGQRLTVVIDTVAGSSWAVLGGASGWQASETPIDDAIEYLCAQR